MENKCCETCRWWLYVRPIEDSICDNKQSVYYVLRTPGFHNCEEWERRQEK